MDPIGEVIPPKTLLTMAWYKCWSCIALFCFRVISGWYTPWKINGWHLKISHERKENDLNQSYRELCSMLIFRGYQCRCWRNKNIFLSAS